jgi:hypothetical protein
MCRRVGGGPMRGGAEAEAHHELHHPVHRRRCGRGLRRVRSHYRFVLPPIFVISDSLHVTFGIIVSETTMRPNPRSAARCMTRCEEHRTTRGFMRVMGAL